MGKPISPRYCRYLHRRLIGRLSLPPWRKQLAHTLRESMIVRRSPSSTAAASPSGCASDAAARRFQEAANRSAGASVRTRHRSKFAPPLTFRSNSEPFEGSPSETIEAVEGFWLARPWLMSDACPAQRAGVPATAAAPAKLVGIAQYFTSEDSRVGQRSGRSYVSVEKIAVGSRICPIPALSCCWKGGCAPGPAGQGSFAAGGPGRPRPPHAWQPSVSTAQRSSGQKTAPCWRSGGAR